MYGQPPPQPPKPSNNGAIIAIITVLVAVLIGGGGFMAVLAVYGTRKYIANAKMAEARNAVTLIAKDAVAAYEGGGHLCPEARPIPSNVSAISGKKYASNPDEWQSDRGWKCLQFELTAPQYYRYSYVPNQVDAFTATAEGDLDGDGVLSTFEVGGAVQAGRLVLGPTIVEENPEE